MNYDVINAELADLADIEREALVEAEYESFIDAMCAEHDMQMYACHSYDLDAIDYGAHY